MANDYRSTVRAIFAPRKIQIIWWLAVAVATYDGIAGQFELPTLRWFIGMSGSLLPWWGWLLVLQGVFTFALFEYVRRNVPVKSRSSPSDGISDEARRNIELDLTTLLYFSMNESTVAFLDGLIAAAPEGTVPRDGDRDHQNDVYNEISRYVRKVVSAVERTHRGTKLAAFLQVAEANAEHELERYLENHPERHSDFSKLRRYLIAEKQRDTISSFLSQERAEVVEKIRADRSGLIERFERRSQG